MLFAGLDIVLVLSVLLLLAWLGCVGFAECECPLSGSGCEVGAIIFTFTGAVCAVVGDLLINFGHRFGHALLQLGVLFQLRRLELFAGCRWAPVPVVRGALLLQGAAAEVGPVAVVVEAIVHVDVIEHLIHVLLVLLRLQLLLLAEIVFDLRKHLGLLLLYFFLLGLQFLLSLGNLLLLEHFGLLFDLLDLLLHFLNSFLVLLFVDVLVGKFDLSNLLEFDLGDVFVYLLELCLIAFLKSVLLLLDRGPDLLNTLLEFFFEFCELVVVQEVRGGFRLNIKIDRDVVGLVKWIV